ncbi:MAG: GLPGLI family protein [Porphyromonas sp.]|nr:GLPGLI family protein [Porphyromonas sp.]
MKAKFALILTLIFGSALSIYGQTYGYRAHYLFQKHYKIFKDKKPDPEEVILEIMPDESHYYSKILARMDSAIWVKVRDGRSVKEALWSDENIEEEGEPIYIRSIFGKQQREVSYRILDEEYNYMEKIAPPEWKILTDSTKKIGAYSCTLASASYLGREWQVWYTQEIPSSAGPWKLSGLPGLILEAKDTEGVFEFSFLGFEEQTEEKSYTKIRQSLLPHLSGRTVSKRKAEELYRSFIEDPFGFLIQTSPNVKIVSNGEQMLTPTWEKMNYIPLER